MKFSFGFFVCVLTVAALLLSFSPAVSATDCGYKVAGRTFGYQFGGFVNFGPGGDQYPNAGGGTFTFMPNGKIRGNLNLTVGPYPPSSGKIIEGLSSYKLSWDATRDPMVCVGTATVVSEVAPPSNFQIVVSQDGNQLNLIHNDLGITITFTAYDMTPGYCGNYTLRGTYAYNATGWMLPPPNLPPVDAKQTMGGFMPFAFSGALRFDSHKRPSPAAAGPEGSSYLEGWDLVALNGFEVPRKYVGWYKVNPDCSATMTLQDDIGNPPITTRVYILTDAEGLLVINTDQGLALSFTSWKVR